MANNKPKTTSLKPHRPLPTRQHATVTPNPTPHKHKHNVVSVASTAKKRQKTGDSNSFVETNKETIGDDQSSQNERSIVTQRLEQQRKEFERSMFGKTTDNINCNENQANNDDNNNDHNEEEGDANMNNENPGENATSPDDMSSGVNSKPSNVYIKKNNMISDSVVNDENTIEAFVLTRFFPQVKFIVDKNRELAYTTVPNSYCQFIINGCNVPEEIDHAKWWEKARKIVINKIQRLRNDRTMQIKFEFWGKLL